MPSPETDEAVHLRRAQNNERFVAFAFAGADMVVETDTNGIITYAAGAYRSRFGRPPESFVGHAMRLLLSAADHEALDVALTLIRERGRLPPMMVRLADAQRSAFVLSGIALASQGCSPRLCLCLARPPAPPASALRSFTAHGLARSTEARLRSGEPCDLGLIEIVGAGSEAITANEAMGQALGRVAPDAIAAELAPGRFGLIGNGGSETDLLATARHLQAALRVQGVDASIAARHLLLNAPDMTLTQTARALRQALTAFARDGAAGFDEAGLGRGLAGYMHLASTRASSVQRAIRGGHFRLMYQPIFALADGAPHHSEALLRPDSQPDSPCLAPQEFVMLVETLGMAEELDMAVARIACQASAEASAPIAFNLSGQSVQSPAFCARLIDLLSGSPACRDGLISVEMTETAELDDVAEAARTAAALRALGVKFCLDDFGAGAADIRLLRALTADIVKLDGSYIPGIVQGGRELAFVAGMVEIARAAGAEIVAERIETEAEADALRNLGVQYGQGWLYGRPSPRPTARPGGPRAVVGRRLTGSMHPAPARVAER